MIAKLFCISEQGVITLETEEYFEYQWNQFRKENRDQMNHLWQDDDDRNTCAVVVDGEYHEDIQYFYSFCEDKFNYEESDETDYEEVAKEALETYKKDNKVQILTTRKTKKKNLASILLPEILKRRKRNRPNRRGIILQHCSKNLRKLQKFMHKRRAKLQKFNNSQSCAKRLDSGRKYRSWKRGILCRREFRSKGKIFRIKKN